MNEDAQVGGNRFGDFLKSGARTIRGGGEITRQPMLDRVMLDEAIARLPPGYRRVFIMHDVEGMEHTEIARELGCSVGTSKSQLHKARLKLRDLLRHRYRRAVNREKKSASLSNLLPESRVIHIEPLLT